VSGLLRPLLVGPTAGLLYLHRIRTALAQAVQQGLVGTNPATGVRLLKPARIRPVVRTATREARLAADRHPPGGGRADLPPPGHLPRRA
jgi:hypothetical protein